jgi:hypothetical protein
VAKYLTTYNGWANYPTWNVALWLSADEGLYQVTMDAQHKGDPYLVVVDMLTEYGVYQTPDGVSYTDKRLNIRELNRMIEGMS